MYSASKVRVGLFNLSRSPWQHELIIWLRKGCVLLHGFKVSEGSTNGKFLEMSHAKFTGIEMSAFICYQ